MGWPLMIPPEGVVPFVLASAPAGVLLAAGFVCLVWQCLEDSWEGKTR